ncbi:Chemotaxis protein CheY [Symmachiella macrocystis]|uniref:Chemotaxis protein CheY n=1 Tax=Symmachiella macrocystis TaxID=2527985 RepID=A0A5C6B158_9PLAN|nr:response regulator [Symmachiella macrocystis]TWU04144.1 Chemotaxis protein CheY [Symmachiella macrocystis]
MPNRLMIVDDALIMRMKIKEIAALAGWTIVAEADNGEDAVVKYNEHQPDLMTLDMVMPKMDGLAALKAIREQHPSARIVMVSAVNQKAKLQECIVSGALDFIVKPFDPEHLKGFFVKYKCKDE